MYYPQDEAVNDGEAREGVRGEKVGGRNGRLGSREGSLNVLVEWPFAKIYTRRHTENRFWVCCLGLCGVIFGIAIKKEKKADNNRA
jgi:hypothetical protein